MLRRMSPPWYGDCRTTSPVPSPSFRFVRWLAVALVFAASAVAPLRAHALNMTRLQATLADQSAELSIEADLVLLLGTPGTAELLRAPADAQNAHVATLAREILAELSVEFTPAAPPWRLVDWIPPDLPADRGGDPGAVAMATFVYQTELPGGLDHTLVISSRPDARLEFPLAYSVLMPAAASALTRWLELPGTSTRPLPVPAAALTPSRPASDVPALAANPTPTAHAPTPWTETVVEYLRLGFLHIIPLGADHILFVLGLFFLGAGWRALAAQITTFTVAHTTTLGLAAYGVLRLPAAVVEPLIALSIAFIALENIFRPRLGSGRLVVVFAFGLLHGLGFAGALSELPLPRDQFLTALLAFNFGVDFGQLAVLAAAFLAVGWFRTLAWYRPAVAIPACILMAATSLFWTAERVFF
jgi:hypothetical protein